MPLTNLLVGTNPNDGTGETLRSGGQKINTNYTFTVTTDTDQTISGVKTFNQNILMASGKGIDFSASPNAAGMTSELLDDYEEGTWTPTAVGSATPGTTTYISQEGRYTKIGRMVHVAGLVEYSAMTGTGQLHVGGFPFSMQSFTLFTGVILPNDLNWTGGTYLTLLGAGGATHTQIYGATDDGGITVQTCVNEAAFFYFSLTYYV
jgi:hypothetical protein